MRRLPPLGALRAFEAAAKHLSFTRAAAELCVTQAAISHQIRQLEDWLGVPLFERRGHALKLTTKGEAYLPELAGALDRIAAATLRVMEPDRRPLHITVLPSFASRWLVPRLEGFRALHPDIDVRVDSSADVWAFASERFDLGIRSGLGKWTGLKADLIAHETLSPVCSPTLADGPPPIRVPADLRHARLLHDTPRQGWRRWCEAAAIEGLDVSTGASFNDASLSLQAAADGQGVALGRLVLAADDLRKGRLVQPFDIAIPNDYSYWLVYPAAALDRPGVAAFRTWLLSEAKRLNKPASIG
ncbi:transcriptional regulator GcvA [Paraburkholderia megapolitana]|uniref:Transcriptional regulator, LysR family n=1 Tax=Paraburkholderia megapolitana TaxID=420953 RepID=A0A1I3DHH4_9BURK|nr:transcriptional regulator GcvA [Paraburkholderia megapolitana]QDQ81848.1 transcriptional regulator GcvA [Paraburkholderia megapolitana]SFH86187.1 transcriptional regulator, LysR family [Paraburkholderia megapolitana]